MARFLGLSELSLDDVKRYAVELDDAALEELRVVVVDQIEEVNTYLRFMRGYTMEFDLENARADREKWTDRLQVLNKELDRRENKP
jgi:hypothetical protein